MAIYRVHKNKNYTTIDNNIFKNKDMSYKTTGLLCTMLSLPEDWDFNISGLVSLKSDKETIVRTALKELEKLGYLTRTKVRSKNGTFIDWQYDIYEQPLVEKPQLEKPQLEKPHVENQAQLNTNKLNTKELNTNKYIFKKPSLEEVEKYCNERHNNIDPKKFIDYYEVNNWVDNKGNKVKNWKQKIITWEGRKQKDNLPTWFYEEPKEKEIDDETRKLIEEIKGTSADSN